jgi:hypothetical protein
LSKGAKGNISKECHKLAQEKNLFDVQAPDEKRKKYDLNEEKLEWIRSCTYKLEFTRLDHLIDCIPSDLPLKKLSLIEKIYFKKKIDYMMKVNGKTRKNYSIDTIKLNLHLFRNHTANDY